MDVSEQNNFIVIIFMLIIAGFVIYNTPKTEKEVPICKCIPKILIISGKNFYKTANYYKTKLMHYDWICNDNSIISAYESEWRYSKIGDTLLTDEYCNTRRK